MDKFVTYKIDLKNLPSSKVDYDFHLDGDFFAAIEDSEVHQGNVNVHLCVKKTIDAFELHFHTEGVVEVACDRCLDEMHQPIHSEDILWVKFGNVFAEEDDNIVVIPEEEGVINIEWFMYEFVALAIPMKHVHADGECNPELMGKLGKVLRTEADDDDLDSSFATEDSFEEKRPIDPRWNELKKILDNN